MKKQSLQLIFIALISFGFILAACSREDEPIEEEVTGAGEDPTEIKEETVEEPTGEPQQGGTITAAMYSAPGGQFNPIFYEDAYENNILSFTHDFLVAQDENLEFTPELAHDWKFNEDQTEITYFLEEDVTWHDGEQFTADDVVFTFTSMADPEYINSGGLRTEFVNKLVGYEEYAAGEADELEGVQAEDDYTVTFTFKEPNVTALYNTSFPIIPEHVFSDIAVEDMAEHPASTDAGEVIGTGPFKLTEMQDGEQYILEKHEEYWKGEPYLDRIQWQVIDQEIMTGMLENGELDLVKDPGGVPKADIETVKQMEHITMFEQQDLGYQYLGFRHHRGPNDSVTDKSTWEPNEKVQDKELRQAIAHAINREGIIEGLLYGSGQVLNAPFPEASWAYDPEAVHQYEYSEDKANELLDNAGYKDTNDDGFRENPEGEEFVLNLDYPTGNKVREDAAPIIKDNLESVGLKVDLRHPRDASAHFVELEKNNTDWDMYLAGWGLASGDPDPDPLHGSESAYNYLRWDNEESDKLIQEAKQAPEAFDLEFREKKYAEWAALFSEELPEIPLYSENNVFAHNSSLHGITKKPHTIVDNSHEWWLEQ
ncbi:peptide-binding protein [Alteribacillus bidgolensis]|uniref:Peptide/nickel transport system substrate-binding protein n=1 Tax=Alteribacillus bidgolensis TaxID=930129 RepID=A0A1G8LNS0_9BACI|nr:peptide-binding protein [Alteribacillus bidgolensis]SDI57359.1 peptide/nickel transport system substrate-binding protein [Alteribacillus bidgolensis]